MSHHHAVIIGGSFSGLLIGRVLAKYFDRVTLIERDTYPDQPIPRKGVPHSRFPHTLMLRGQQLLEQLFPGIKAELIAEGAIDLDTLKEVAFLTPAGWAVRFDSDLMLLSCSRDLLDWSIRRRFAAFPNVQFLTETSVTGLLSDATHSKIVGVSLHQNETLYADLVVDASGKASHTPQWLKSLGYSPPPETEVNGFVGYVARIVQPPPELSVDWKMLFAPTAPPDQNRGGAVFPIEGNRWIVSLVGGDRDYPPTDEAGFLAFARSLSTPVIATVIERSTPLTPIYAYYGNENRQRHYDRCSHPSHLIAVGHAACSLNPTYGQAMTVAALEAMTIDRFFQHHAIEDLDTRTVDLRKQLAKAHQEAWTAAIGVDYRYKSTQGKPSTATTRLINWYWYQLMELMVDRPAVYHTFLEVLHLLKPSIVLFQPSILVEVLAHAWRKRFQRVRSHQTLTISTD